MPQLSQAGAIYASQLFWLAIVFALIYFGIGRAMVPRIERTIDDRAARIERDLAAAEAARAQATGLRSTYEAGMDTARSEAAKAIAAAQAEAAHRLEQRLKAATAETDAQVDSALARIEDSRRAASGELETVVADAAAAILAKLTSAAPDRATLEHQAKAALAHG